MPRQHRFLVALTILATTTLLLPGCAAPPGEHVNAANESKAKYQTVREGTPLSRDQYERYAVTGEWPGGRYTADVLPIHFATNPDEIEQLIAVGADVDARDGSGRTALHHMARSADNHHEAIAALVDAGADVNATTAQGRTPLIIASGGRQAIPSHRSRGVAALIEAGADVNYAGADQTALVAALHAGNAGIVRQLLAAGANPSQSGEAGETAHDAVTAILVRAEEAASSGQPMTAGLRNRVRAAEAVLEATSSH